MVLDSDFLSQFVRADNMSDARLTLAIEKATLMRDELSVQGRSNAQKKPEWLAARMPLVLSENEEQQRDRLLLEVAESSQSARFVEAALDAIPLAAQTDSAAADQQLAVCEETMRDVMVHWNTYFTDSSLLADAVEQKDAHLALVERAADAFAALRTILQVPEQMATGAKPKKSKRKKRKSKSVIGTVASYAFGKTGFLTTILASLYITGVLQSYFTAAAYGVESETVGATRIEDPRTLYGSLQYSVSQYCPDQVFGSYCPVFSEYDEEGAPFPQSNKAPNFSARVTSWGWYTGYGATFVPQNVRYYTNVFNKVLMGMDLGEAQAGAQKIEEAAELLRKEAIESGAVYSGTNLVTIVFVFALIGWGSILLYQAARNMARGRRRAKRKAKKVDDDDDDETEDEETDDEETDDDEEYEEEETETGEEETEQDEESEFTEIVEPTPVPRRRQKSVKKEAKKKKSVKKEPKTTKMESGKDSAPMSEFDELQAAQEEGFI